MMDQLIRVAGEMRSEVHALLRKSIDVEFVQGAVLEVDRYWYEWAVFTQLGYYHGFWPQPEAQEVFAWVLLHLRTTVATRPLKHLGSLSSATKNALKLGICDCWPVGLRCASASFQLQIP